MSVRLFQQITWNNSDVKNQKKINKMYLSRILDIYQTRCVSKCVAGYFYGTC